MRVAVLNRLVSVGFIEKVIFPQRLEGDEGVSPIGKSSFRRTHSSTKAQMREFAKAV